MNARAPAPFTRIAACVFGIVAVLHGLRALAGWPVSIADVPLPPWASVVSALGAGFLGAALWREARR